MCGNRGKSDDSEKGVEWIGCDCANECGRWFHYSCLSYDVQIAVNMSIVEASEWFCSECAEMTDHVNNQCPVCMRTVVSRVDGNCAICSECAGACHLKCLSERRQIQYHTYIVKGRSWFCNNCA